MVFWLTLKRCRCIILENIWKGLIDLPQFKEILPENINKNIFSLIGKDWMLISATNGEKTNAMTASWGGAGVMWNKNVVCAVIRPQRYTKEFVDSSDFFTLSFFDESYRETLGYFGRVSGRDEDKIKNTGLTVKNIENGVVGFEEAKMMIVCKKLYASPLAEEGFIDKTLIEKNYKDGDFHVAYIGEIIKVMEK